MTTAIIGVGNIGSALAANLVRGGEDVVLASRTLKHAQAISGAYLMARLFADGSYRIGEVPSLSASVAEPSRRGPK